MLLLGTRQQRLKRIIDVHVFIHVQNWNCNSGNEDLLRYINVKIFLAATCIFMKESTKY
jgi:hypothetical protein